MLYRAMAGQPLGRSTKPWNWCNQQSISKPYCLHFGKDLRSRLIL